LLKDKNMEEEKQQTEQKKEESSEKIPPQSGEDARNSNSAEGGKNFGKTKEPVKEIHHHHYHEYRGFNLGRFLLGMIVVIAGLAYLAKTTGWINLNINVQWANLWPLLIIFIGLSLISFRGWLGAILGILISLVVLAFVALLVFNVLSPSWNIQGSGNVITEERTVSDFNKISFSGVGNLIIEQGDKESLKIEAEDNIVPKIQTSVQDQTLKIDYEWNWFSFSFNPNKPINIYVTVKDLQKIEGSGATTIKSQGIKTENLEIKGSGAAKADISVEVQQLNSEISGAGDFVIAGKADSQKIQISGAAKYEAKNLISKTVDIEVSGAGLAAVNAQEQLNVEISGAAKVSYLGNPRLTQKISGAGKIEKLSE
jgi:hypothetical protein